MGSIFQGWKGRWVRSGLGMAFLGLSIGCTNNGTNTLPTKNQLPPPKPFQYSGVEPVNSPAYKNLPGSNQPASGATFNNFSPNNSTTATLPTTRIGGPESVRPDARSAMNPQIGVPNNPVGNPASFNGPSGGQNVPPNPIQPVNYNPSASPNPPSSSNPPVQQMQPLSPVPPPAPSQSRAPAVSPLPSSNATTNTNASAPAWPSANSNPQPIAPTNWNAPPASNSGTFNPAPANNNNGSNLNPVPPPPPVGFNTPGSSSDLQPLRLPESVSAKAASNPTIQPVGAPSLGTLDPVPDNTPAPILAPPTKTTSALAPPQQQPRRDIAPPPPISMAGSDDIPAAPIIPQR